MNDAVLVGGAALVGVAVVGPLLNHAIVWWIGWRVVLPPCLGRVPTVAQVGRPPARCRACGRALAPNGLRAVPATVVAARCRGCDAGLARGYVAVELVTGALFAVTAGVVGWSAALVPLLALAAGSVAMSAVDLAVMRIPTRFVHATAGLVAAGLVLAALVDGPVRRLAGAAVGAAAYGGFLLVLHLISPRALGFGDVRLATLVGAVAGWCAWRVEHPVLAPVQGAVNAGLLAGLVGSVVGLVLLLVRGRDHPFPFGPAIAAGGLVVALGLV
ncbi:MAG TPA: A24 family peptidase [Acidimicrobiales bacterium]|nr:A24 family peptidase [Acidimicrobiales bacterium]